MQIFLCCVYVCAHLGTHVEVREQVAEVALSWGLNSSCQAWQQAPVIVKPSHRPQRGTF